MFRTAQEAMRFILSGRATVTFKGRTDRFTYKITAPKTDDGKTNYDANIRFVKLLTGSDNESSYQYLGFIKLGVYFHGDKSRIGKDAPAAKAFAWTFSRLMKGEMPAGLEVWHEGKCGRCNRKLTVPESIASGFGPECIGRV